MTADSKEAPIRRMTDDEGRDMGESFRRLKGLFEKAPQETKDLKEPQDDPVVKQDV